jgi:ABC-type sugar transport system ATPase subunit
VELSRPSDAIKVGVGYVPEDRKASSLLLTRTVRHNLSIAWNKHLSHFGFLDVRREGEMARKVMDQFAIIAPSCDSPIVQLSGGNQQKVVLARWFSMAPDVLVLAEPTRGIDVGAKSEVYRFIQDMAEVGTGTVLISSEMPEILGLADRILVMFRGTIVGELDGSTATEEEITHLALGGAMQTAKGK